MILESLADLVCDISYATLSSRDIATAEKCLFDLIGVTYGALARPEAAALQRYATGLDATGPSPIWGTGQRAPAAEAAMINGALGYVLEFDDGISLGGHWSSSSIPAILALAAETGKGVEEVIVAIVAAVETGTRISRSMAKGLLESGVHFPGVMSTFAATAGAARMLDLSAAQTASALGHACLTPVAPYVAAHGGSYSKNLFSGWGNLCGIHFARLAAAGFSGPHDLLEGRDGLATTLGWSGTSDGLAATILQPRDGHFITETYFKKYPCCRWLHAPINAILKLRTRVSPAAVEAITVFAPEFLRMYDGPVAELDAASAKYSLGYTCAAALVLNTVTEAAFQPELVHRPDLQNFAGRVRFQPDTELEADFPAQYRTRVELRLITGETVAESSALPWSFTSPPPKSELRSKFESLMEAACTDEQLEQWLALYDAGLAAPEAMARLSRLLGAPSARSFRV